MLAELDSEKILEEVPGLEQPATSVSRGVHNWILKGGEPRRKAADILHGMWLGHPLHPVLTDITIGAWTFSFVFDLLSLSSHSRSTRRAADTLLNIGNVSAIGTALTGLADYSTIRDDAIATGATHGLLNTLGLGVALFSSLLRKKGHRQESILLSSLSFSIVLIAAWLGGEMPYKYKVGVNKIPEPTGPNNWHPTINDQDLPEKTPKRVDVEGSPVLLYRYQGQVYAIGAICGHEAGNLDQGSFDGYCVTCPLHQSVYDLRDGSIVHGPTTYPEPSYEVRLREGMIEIRLAEKPLIRKTIQMMSDGKRKM